MSARSATFKKMFDQIEKMKSTVTVSADYKSDDGLFRPDAQDHGGSTIIGVIGSKGAVMDTIAHETAHAYHQSIGTEARDVRASVPGFSGIEPSNQEEVNAFATAHRVDSELNNQSAWSGPPWGNTFPRALSSATFSANYSPNQVP